MLVVNGQGVIALLALRLAGDGVEVDLAQRQRRVCGGDVVRRASFRRCRAAAPPPERVSTGLPPCFSDFTANTDRGSGVRVAQPDGVDRHALFAGLRRPLPPFAVAGRVVAVGQQQDVAGAAKRCVVGQQGRRAAPPRCACRRRRRGRARFPGPPPRRPPPRPTRGSGRNRASAGRPGGRCRRRPPAPRGGRRASSSRRTGRARRSWPRSSRLGVSANMLRLQSRTTTRSRPGAADWSQSRPHCGPAVPRTRAVSPSVSTEAAPEPAAAGRFHRACRLAGAPSRASARRVRQRSHNSSAPSAGSNASKRRAAGCANQW